jgi:hypothetical protein
VSSNNVDAEIHIVCSTNCAERLREVEVEEIELEVDSIELVTGSEVVYTCERKHVAGDETNICDNGNG